MNVLDAINDEFSIAATQFPQIHKQWVGASIKVGGQLVRLMRNIQTDGNTDLVLRMIELEIQKDFGQLEQRLFAFDRYSSLSRAWLITMYENLRTYCQFNKPRTGEDRSAFYISMHGLTNKFAKVRVPLAKLEIQGTHKKGAPAMELVPVPARPGDSIKQYVRGSVEYTPRMGIDRSSGSVVWGVIDIESGGETWITRQELANEFLTLCA